MHVVTVQVGTLFMSYVEPAMVRLGYLYPDLKIEYDRKDQVIRIYLDKTDSRADEIKKEVNYVLYREKIYQETLTIRKQIIGSQ